MRARVSAGVVVLVALAVLLGALTQRTTGLGFALVSAPFLVIVAGPETGVSLSNALAAILCVTVLLQTWRSTRWRSVAVLAVPALCVVPIGGLVVAAMAPGPLLLLVGLMSLLAVLVVVVSRDLPALAGTAGAVGAGAASGLMNVTAGLGGPMMTAYALTQRWPREVFIPTAQAYLLLVNIGSLAVKGLPALSGGAWGLTIGALVVGAVGGHWLSPHITPAVGHRFVVAVALAGGLVATVRGASAVLG